MHNCRMIQSDTNRHLAIPAPPPIQGRKGKFQFKLLFKIQHEGRNLRLCLNFPQQKHENTCANDEKTRGKCRENECYKSGRGLKRWARTPVLAEKGCPQTPRRLGRFYQFMLCATSIGKCKADYLLGTRNFYAQSH